MIYAWLRRMFGTRVTWQEKAALEAAIHFLNKPLSELKQYASDNHLMGANSRQALISLLAKVKALEEEIAQ